MRNRDAKTGRFSNNKNEWVVDNGLYYCYLNGELLFFTDVEQLMNYSWGRYANGYSSAVINGKKIQAHRYILNPKPEDIVDHINRNKKDNRRSNLRITNKSVNSFNTDIRSSNTSGCTGVYYRKDTNRWAAEIKVNGKKHVLGCFKEYEKAVIARRNAEREYYAS